MAGAATFHPDGSTQLQRPHAKYGLRMMPPLHHENAAASRRDSSARLHVPAGGFIRRGRTGREPGNRQGARGLLRDALLSLEYYVLGLFYALLTVLF